MVDFAYQTKSEAVEFAVIDTIPGSTDKLALNRDQREFVLNECKRIIRNCDTTNSLNGVTILNLEDFMRRLSNPGADTCEYDSGFIGSIPCYIGWLFARVLADGNVNSCLKSHRIPIGNIYNQSFREIWNSPEQIRFRQKTLRFDKEDPFFSYIGNDPNCKIGCYKSCDDIARNINMHKKIQNLSSLERRFLKWFKLYHIKYKLL
jgi:MoaA/NifB/PqqE/SkfB family radical SAM enzyme